MEAESRRPSLSVSAVILTHTPRPELEVVLDRLREAPVSEILVVQNDPAGDPPSEAPSDDRIRVVRPGGNVGVAGRNIAAREAKGELLLMLDDDAYPLSGAIELLAEAFAASPRLGVGAGFVRDVDDERRVMREDEVGTFDWFLRSGRKGPAPPEGFETFFFPEGACMVRRTAFLEVGGFFEPFFRDVVELEVAARLLAAGWDVRYFPAAVFEHLKAASGRASDRERLRYRIRNQIWYFWLHFPSFLAVRRTAAYLLFDLIECGFRGVPSAWSAAVSQAWSDRDIVRRARRPLPRDVLRRAELNRGRMHVRLLWAQLRRRMSGSRRGG